MSSMEQRMYTEAEKGALVGAARDWKGTQRQFAAEHGVSQGTVSKWLGAAARREYTEADREEALKGYRSWRGTQTAYARARGMPQTTLSRWVQGDRQSHRDRSPRDVALRSEAPAMLEVVPVAAPAPLVACGPSLGVRLSLGDGVVLALEALPPARWVAELAVELRRC